MELQGILEVNDFKHSFKVEENLGTTLTRIEIEGVLVANDIALPLQNDVSFKIADNHSHYFFVYYDVSLDVYAYQKFKGV